jgi:LacI family transcriptional regulator
MKKRTPKHLRLQDVATLAGVSLTTASMYLNGKARKYKIAKATCERIEQVIQDNNFVPNVHARAIANKKTYLIGVLLSESLNKSFWIDLLTGVEEEISQSNYHPVISVSHRDPAREREALEFMQSKGVDGYVVAPILNEDDNNFPFLRKIAEDKPLVTLNCQIQGLSGASNDEDAGGAIVAEHFIAKGHTAIAYVGPLRRWTPRGISFIDTCRKAGVRVKSFSCIDQFLKHADKYSAVFCCNDYVLAELYGKAATLGLKIPKDLSVAGYDDLDFVKLLAPCPTTVHTYKKEVGAAVGKKLMELINAQNPCVSSYLFTPYLVPGASVADAVSKG